MLKREVSCCPLSRRAVVALCVGAALAVLTMLPGVGRAAAMSDSEFDRLCAAGTAEQVRQALKEGANPNARDELGGTALMSAVRRWEERERLETTRALLSAGADVNARDEMGGTALIEAAPSCDAEVARLLLDGGANVNARDKYGWTALMKVGSPDETEQEPTDEACLATARALLAAGADVNLQAESGASALSELWNRGAVFRALLDAGANVNQRNQAGRTPLMSAAAEGSPDAVRTLLNAGADPSLKDNDGHDAAWSVRHEYEEEYDYEGAEQEAARNRAAIIRLLQGGGANKPAAKKKR